MRLTLTSAALAWLSDHHGIINSGRLTLCGVSRRTKLALVDAGTLIAVYPGVYRIASQPISLESRCSALCALHRTGFVTGRTAGRLLGLRRMGSGSEINFCAPHGLGRAEGDDVFLRQSRRVDRTDFHVRSDGVRIASPWRLAFDLAANLSEHDHASVVEQILERKLCGLDTLVSTGRRLVHNARPGSRRFVATLMNRLPGGPMESDPEVRLAKALQARGVPVEVQATRLRLPNGRTARLDLCVSPIRWGIEVDVHPDHLLLEGTTKDERRDRQARLIGWQIERVTGLDLLDLDTLVDELIALYELRRVEIDLLARASS